jgi:hypothetical protein
MKLWGCKIGGLTEEQWHALGAGADSPLREAVSRAYVELTGECCDFLFSGWDEKLDAVEAEVVIDELKKE